MVSPRRLRHRDHAVALGAWTQPDTVFEAPAELQGIIKAHLGGDILDFQSTAFEQVLGPIQAQKLEEFIRGLSRLGRKQVVKVRAR